MKDKVVNLEYKKWQHIEYDGIGKFCSHCHIFKDNSEFNRNSKCTNGLQANCKECSRLLCKLARQRYKEQNKNREFLPDETRVCCLCKIEKHKSKFYKISSDKQGCDPICIECNLRNNKNSDRVIKERKKDRDWRSKLRNEILDHYGRKCECCGFEGDEDVLCIDHIDGNGCKDRKSKGGNCSTYRWIRNNNFPSGFRILCWNCNMSMGHYGYCPHSNLKPNLAHKAYNVQDIKSQAKRRQIKFNIIEHYGGRCEICKEARIEFLAIDHINGGGRQHRKMTGDGQLFYKWLINNNFPDGFRVLCHNCNGSLGVKLVRIDK